jgi:hypothetical protein
MGVLARSASSILEEIIEGLASVIRLRRQPCRCLLLHAHADGIKSTVVARVFFGDPLWNRLHAFKAARRIKVGALLAGVQLKGALRTLAERLGKHGQQRAALRAARNRMRAWHLHGSRTERVVFILATWCRLLGRLLARLATILISVLPVLTVRQKSLPI